MVFFRRLHRSEQYTTSSQHCFHAFLHSKGRWQTGQILEGRGVFLKRPLAQGACRSLNQSVRNSQLHLET